MHLRMGLPWIQLVSPAHCDPVLSPMLMPLPGSAANGAHAEWFSCLALNLSTFKLHCAWSTACAGACCQWCASRLPSRVPRHSQQYLVCRGQLQAELAACILHYAAHSVPAQTADLLLRALAKGTAAAAVELEASVEAAAAAVSGAVQQLPGMQAAVPSVAWGILQRLLLGPEEVDLEHSVKVSYRCCCCHSSRLLCTACHLAPSPPTRRHWPEGRLGTAHAGSPGCTAASCLPKPSQLSSTSPQQPARRRWGDCAGQCSGSSGGPTGRGTWPQRPGVSAISGLAAGSGMPRGGCAAAGCRRL